MSKTLKHKIEKFGREKVLEAFLMLQKHFMKQLEKEGQNYTDFEKDKTKEVEVESPIISNDGEF